MESTSPTKAAFFSQANVDTIQMALVRRFHRETGMTIDRQSDEELETMMGGVWSMNGNYKDVKGLNEIVIDDALQQIRVGVKHHLDWHKLQGQPQLITRGVPGKHWNPLVLR